MSGKIDEVSFDDLENVELHRANSLPGGTVDFVINEKEKEVIKTESPNNVFVIYIVSGCSTLLTGLKQMKIEVVMFLYMFSYMMRSVSSTTMILDKVCAVHFQYSEDICKNINNYSEIKVAVEKLANNYHLGHSMIQYVPSSLFAVFIGCWSDKYGRKLPIIVALMGIIIDGLGSTICAALFYSRVEYYFIPAFFTGLSGGFIGVLTVIYSYAADTTTFKKRTMKYAIMEMCFGLSMPLGQLAGGWLYKASSYACVFLASTFGHVLGLAWVLFVLEETRGLDNKDSWPVKFRNFWSFRHVKEGFAVTIKKRPNRGKEQILWLMVAMSFAVLSLASTANISYMYAYHRYNWNNTKYSTIAAIFSVIGTLVMTISVPIFKKLNFGDPTLGLVGSGSMVLKYLAMGLAPSQGFYILANFAGLFSGLATLAGRSRISKVASKEDIGKIFSVLTTAEAFLPLLATAIVTQVFNATLEIFPGLIYVSMGTVLMITFGVFLWLSRLPAVDYEEMYNSQSMSENNESNTHQKNLEKF